MTSEIRYRSAHLSRQSVDEGARIIRGVSVSSNEPYERYYGTEILNHTPEAIDLSRVVNGASPLLYNHDRDALIGKVSNPQLRNGKLYVDLKFSQSDIGRQMLADVKDGILTECSIGYEVNKFEVDEDKETYTATLWTLFECSLVSIPADYTVGVGRDQNQPHEISPFMKTQTRSNDDDHLTETQRERHNRSIRELVVYFNGSPNFKGKLNYDLEGERFVSEHKTLDEFQSYCMKEAFQDVRPLQTPDREASGHLMNRESDRSIAEQIVEHAEFRRMREGGQKTVSFNLPNVRNFREALSRATISTADVGTTIQRLPSIQGVSYEQLTVADLLAPGSTTSGKITYPREVSFISQATTVAEGGLKPAQSFNLVEDEASAKKIAATCVATDELLEDSPAAESYITNRLAFAVLKQEDTQILYGDGLGSNMRGIFNTPGLQVQPRGADIAPDALRRAINAVETNTDFMVTGIVLHPTDFMNLELLKDTQGRYLVSQVMVFDETGRQRMAPALWNKPLSVSKGAIPGTALCGAFRTAGQLFRRSGLRIEMSNSDQDNFVRNLITIRAELRAALAIYAGAAFCEVTGL